MIAQAEDEYDQREPVDLDEVALRKAKLLDLVLDLATLREVDRAYVAYALAFHGGNRMKTAEKIGCDRRTIQRWTKESGG